MDIPNALFRPPINLPRGVHRYMDKVVKPDKEVDLCVEGAEATSHTAPQPYPVAINEKTVCIQTSLGASAVSVTVDVNVLTAYSGEVHPLKPYFFVPHSIHYLVSWHTSIRGLKTIHTAEQSSRSALRFGKCGSVWHLHVMTSEVSSFQHQNIFSVHSGVPSHYGAWQPQPRSGPHGPSVFKAVTHEAVRGLAPFSRRERGLDNTIIRIRR